MPGDPTFNQFNNHYDVASYNRLCNEFGIKPSSDFRFASGKKTRSVRRIHLRNRGWSNENSGFNKFSDEGGHGANGKPLTSGLMPMLRVSMTGSPQTQALV